jgi:hypothetical protein
MPKKLFWAPGLIAMAALMIVFLFFPTVGYAKRGTWAGFQGSVKTDMHNAPLGSLVTAWIQGSNAGPWSTKVYPNSGISSYSLNIPEDSGTGVKDGGTNGDVICFSLTVNGQVYIDPVKDIWQRGVDKNHPISVFTPVIAILNDQILPDATVGKYYSSEELRAQGGTGPYTWQATNLPAGLFVSGTNIIGTPAASTHLTAKQTIFNVKLTVTDFYGFKSEKTILLNLIWQSGDANGDGVIDMGDVVKVTRIYSGWDSPTPGADANSDFYINMLDVTWILNNIMGP